MPAKRQYLSSPGQRALKISAGIIGGYFLSAALHVVLGVVTPFAKEINLTSAFTLFIFWVLFMILAFIAKNGWKIWGIYLFAIIVCSLIVYFFKFR